MSNLGNIWRARLEANASQQAQSAAIKAQRVFLDEANRLIEKIPELIEVATQKNEDTINVLGRCLVSSDVVNNDVDVFIASIGNGIIQAQQLAGTARIVFEWCDANGLACETHGFKVSYDREYNLIARPK